MQNRSFRVKCETKCKRQKDEKSFRKDSIALTDFRLEANERLLKFQHDFWNLQYYALAVFSFPLFFYLSSKALDIVSDFIIECPSSTHFRYITLGAEVKCPKVIYFQHIQRTLNLFDSFFTFEFRRFHVLSNHLSYPMKPTEISRPRNVRKRKSIFFLYFTSCAVYFAVVNS